MTGVSINEPKYSVFTLALMEDSGWYQANYDMADSILWGKGDGCAFLTQKCQSAQDFEEFCNSNQDTSCDVDGS